MGLITVIMSIALCIICNIFINSFDVYTDIMLATNTLTFEFGSSLLLSGCRFCYGKEDEDIFSMKNDSCQYCLTENYEFECGMSIEILEKINELENSETCTNDRFSVKWNSSSTSYVWNQDSCETIYHDCCIETGRRANIKNPFDKIDKRILVLQPQELSEIRNEIDYDIFIASGKLRNWYCQGLFYEYFSNSSTLASFIHTNVEQAKTTLNENQLSFHFESTLKGKGVLKRGFKITDECGVFVLKKENNHVKNNGETCGSSACLVHLQYLKMHKNISDLNDWKEQAFVDGGIKFGGKICKLLLQYGTLSLAPISLSLTFHLLLFLKDTKQGHTSNCEIIFVFLQFYPQWKTLRFLFKFIMDRDENRLNQEKDHFDKQIAGLEPFTESAFQVNHFLDCNDCIWNF